jgi:ribosomal-protein-alanine N-acetyltransferase
VTNRCIQISDAAKLAQYYSENRGHLSEWEPVRENEFYTAGFWESRLDEWEAERLEGSSRHFVALHPESGQIQAVCSLTNIVRGAFQACNVGYSVALESQGQGIMCSLLVHVVDYAFTEIGLNRVMANYMPRNTRSQRLLDRVGFAKEGLAKNYLCINSVWEDHVLTSILNPAID